MSTFDTSVRIGVKYSLVSNTYPWMLLFVKSHLGVYIVILLKNKTAL